MPFVLLLYSLRHQLFWDLHCVCVFGPQRFRTLFFVDLTALEGRPLLCIEISGTKYPVTQRRVPQELTYHSHRCENLRIRIQWGLPTVCGMCNIHTCLELMDPKEQVLFVFIYDEGRASFCRAVCTSAMRALRQRSVDRK
jgi:hypothetical protein